MRKLLLTLVAGLVAVALVASTAGAAPPPKTVVDLAVGASGTPNAFDEDGGDFDILVAAVLALGLADGLAGDGQRTVFAPTDQAFLDLVEELTGTAPASEADAFAAVAGVPGVADIVAYHVSGTRLPGAKVATSSSLPTITGQAITKDRFSLVLDAGDLGAGPREATVVAPDLRARNGVVHAIDAVLIP